MPNLGMSSGFPRARAIGGALQRAVDVQGKMPARGWVVREAGGRSGEAQEAANQRGKMARKDGAEKWRGKMASAGSTDTDCKKYNRNRTWRIITPAKAFCKEQLQYNL